MESWLSGGNVQWTLANEQTTLTGLDERNFQPLVAKLNNYGELAERSKAAVLKTVEVRASWGSNP